MLDFATQALCAAAAAAAVADYANFTMVEPVCIGAAQQDDPDKLHNS